MSENKRSSYEDIKKLIESFFKDNKPQVLAITGEWGIGKTYTWNDILKKNKSHLCFEKYSYVSMFGIDSIKNIEKAIFNNIVKKEFAGSPASFKTKMQAIVSIVKNISEFIPQPFFKSLAKCSMNFILDLVEKNYTLSINKILICIDDLERKDKKLSLLDILGIISQLKEEKECKIVLIFNESEFNEQDKVIFNRYKEKVIDKNLFLNLKPDERFELIFSKNDGNLIEEVQEVPKVQKFINVIKQSSVQLEIKNMRTLRKIKDRLNDNNGLLDLLKEYEDEFKKDVKNNIVDEDKGKSIFDDKDLRLYEKVRNRVICNYVKFQKTFLERDKNKGDLKLEDYKFIDMKENGIDYSLPDKLKELIVKYIENWYLFDDKKEEFKDALNEFSNEIEKKIFKIDKEILDDRFYNLENRQINFIEIFNSFYFKYFKFMHVQDIDDLLYKLMNISDKNLICNDYSNIIRHFDENIMNNSLPYDVKYDRNGFKEQKYEYKCQEFEKVVENKIIKKEDKSLFEILMDHKSLKNKDIEKISNASENSIYIELKNNLSRLSNFVVEQFIIFNKSYNTKYLKIFEKIIFSVEKLLEELPDCKDRLSDQLLPEILSDDNIPNAFKKYQSLENKKIDLSETFINDVISSAINIRNKKGYSVHGQAVELVKEGEFTVPTY